MVKRGVAPQVARMMVTTRMALAPRMDDPRRNCGAKRWPRSQDVHDEREAENEGVVVWSQTFFIQGLQGNPCKPFEIPMLEARIYIVLA